MQDPVNSTTTVTRAESGRQGVKRFIMTLTTIVVILLILRLIFRFFGANESNVFVNLIYMITNPLVWPFQAIFPDLEFGGLGENGVLEAESLIAIVIWSLVGWLIGRLVAPNRPEVVHRTDTDII